jgi:KUP system potassium uptake protein
VRSFRFSPKHPSCSSRDHRADRFGFQDVPDIPATLRLAAEQHLLEGEIDLGEVSYFLSQITIVPSDHPGLSTWRKKLFLKMARNAASPVDYFALPDDQTVTMSERINL